jgi:Deltamethrin resistance
LLCNFHIHFFLVITKTTRRSYGKGSTIRPVTMNEMPVPEGDFMALYNKRQQTHHAVLALGICMAGFGLTMVSIFEIFSCPFISKHFFRISVSSD